LLFSISGQKYLFAQDSTYLMPYFIKSFTLFVKVKLVAQFEMKRLFCASDSSGNPLQ